MFQKFFSSLIWNCTTLRNWSHIGHWRIYWLPELQHNKAQHGKTKDAHGIAVIGLEGAIGNDVRRELRSFVNSKGQLRSHIIDLYGWIDPATGCLTFLEEKDVSTHAAIEIQTEILDLIASLKGNWGAMRVRDRIEKIIIILKTKRIRANIAASLLDHVSPA